jgi:spermidine synthase
MKPYLLIPIGVIVCSLYFYTWFAFTIGMIQKSFHRKIWNSILLITFLVTAILGILQAILINFKFEVSYVKEILNYHVNFGIAMSIIAVFHLWWHLPYYLPFLNSKKNNEEFPKVEASKSADYTPKQVKTILFILGISTSMIQVIFLRLFLSIFYGNELIIGIFLAVWMSLTGLGSWLGSKRDIKIPGTQKKMTLLLSYSFFALIIGTLMSLFKAWFIPAGVLINTWQLIMMLVLFLIPVCICSGHVFRRITSTYTDQGAENYASETAGSIVGGIIITFSVVLFLEPLQILALVFGLNIMISAIIFTHKMILKYTAFLIALTIPIVFIVFQIDVRTKSLLFNNQKIIESRDTPYGALTITETAGQLNLFSNMALQYTGGDVEHNEETAHFPCLQHKNPSKILLISSGYMGIVPEMLKYPSVREIVYVEPNPWFLKYTEKYFTPNSNKKIKTIQQDPRRFLLSDTTLYDVIIMDVAEPSTLQLNRYYSLEFIELLKKHSTQNTIVSYSLSTSGNYLNKENLRLHSIMYNTMHKVFTNVLIVPGNRNYFLASDGQISLDYNTLFNSKNVDNLYVNPNYIDNRSLIERSEFIQNKLDPEAPENTDLTPTALWAQTINFFSLFNVNTVVLLIVMIVILLAPLLRLNLVSYSVYITGFTASSLEMLILFTFQMLFGYLYAAAGFIFAIFMSGLSLGARQQKKWGDSSLFKIQFWLIIVALAVSCSILFLPKIRSVLVLISIIGVITFIPAYITGHQFALALGKLPGDHANKTGYLYGVDLLGSALGLLIVSAVLIPAFGYVSSIFMLVAINFVSALILYYLKK